MLTEMADELIFSYFSFAVWAELEIFVVHCRAISFRVYKFFNKIAVSNQNAKEMRNNTMLAARTRK